jgi:cystathionine gamma-synthase
MPRRHAIPYTNSVCPPAIQTATYYFNSTDEVISYHRGAAGFGRYGRYDNPGWIRVEQQLAKLEQAEDALIFPSGMSAITATFLAHCKAGDRILFSGKGYRNVRNLCQDILVKFGIDVVSISTADAEEFTAQIAAAYDARCKLIFLEVPSNPHLYLVDIKKIADFIADETVLVVDSTFATPINMLPLTLGADLVVHSCGKYIGGHDDLLCGSVAGSKLLIDAIRKVRNVTGSICDTASTALLERSLKTLDMRMRALNANGYEIASWLDKHPMVARVYYPGLKSHPHNLLAIKQMRGFGGVVSFEIKADLQSASSFVDRIQTAFMGTNFGGTLPLIEQVAVFTYFKEDHRAREELGISDNLIRLSVGCDDPAILLSDIDSALSQINGSTSASATGKTKRSMAR